MFALAAAALILGYAFMYSGYEDMATKGHGPGLFASLGLPALTGGAVTSTTNAPNGSGNMGGQPASPSHGGQISI